MTDRRVKPTVIIDPAIVRRYPTLLRLETATRLRMTALVAALAMAAAIAIWRLDVSLWRVVRGVGELGTFVVLMVPPTPGTWANAALYLHALAETVAIAFLGTLIAAILAFPLGLLAARNVTASRIVQFASRRSLDTVRGVDTLIWALIWINVVGLGPFAGVLAILTSDLGTFGKLYSEAIEAADRKPVEGVTAAGGGKIHEIRFGLLPQVVPVMLSQVLYYFESNTRSATIIGIVGAGGIGLHLTEQIRVFEWQRVSFLILMILVTVAVIDWISGRLRMAIIGRTPVLL
jgi:phosphonate transport system permease protein